MQRLRSMALNCCVMKRAAKHVVRKSSTSLAGCLASSLALAGCAMFGPTPAERAQYLEPMLSAAGFRQLPADTPDKVQRLAKLAPLRVSHYVGKDGKMRYWFADPDYCHCFYVGDEAAYDKYQDLRLQARNARDEKEAAEENYDAAQQMQDIEQQQMMDPFVGLGPSFETGFGPGFGPGFGY